MKEYVGSREEETVEIRPASIFRTVFYAFVVAISYYLGAMVGLALLFPNLLISALWPPNAIMLAVLLMTSARRWWIYLLAVIPAHLIAVGTIGTPLWRMFWQIAFNTIIVVLTASSLRRFSKGNLCFDRKRSVIVYLATITVTLSLSCFFSPAVGLALMEGRDIGTLWSIGFLQHFIGFIALTPVILLLFAGDTSWIRGVPLKQWLERFIVAVGLITVCVYTFEVQSLNTGISRLFLYMPLPFLLWASVRFGPRGMYSSILILTLVSSWSAVRGGAPFVAFSPIEDVFFLQLFLISISIPLMLLAAVIQERHRARQELKTSEAKFRRIFESDIVPFVFWQADGRIIDANDAYLKLTGFTHAEMDEGLLRWLELTPKTEESSDQVSENYQANGLSSPYEQVFVLRDGRRVPVLVGSSYLEGFTDRGVGFAVDLSERKRAEEALRESEERLRLALEAGRMGVWDWDPKTNLAKWSEVHFENFGLEPFSIEQTYDNWAKQVHPNDLPRVVAAMKKSIEERIEYIDEYRIVRADGTIRWIGVCGKPLYNDAGECVRMMGLSTDITERKLAEWALRRSEDALRESHTRIEFLAGRLIVAQEEERKHIARQLHDDLIQQLAALAIGLGQLDRMLPHSDDSIRAQITKLDGWMSHLSEQIRRLSHELHSSTLEHVGLAAALSLYCAEFSALQGIEVNFKIQEGIEPLPAETALCLYRVVQESLRNVAKHSGSKVAEVALWTDDDSIELRITDEGVGFDLEEAKARLGLGLINMEERVKLVHGKFEVKSGHGAGTELVVSIPLNSPSLPERKFDED